MVVFPDCNIFAHFKPIEGWDWNSEKDETFGIGLCMCVIGELDKIKYSATSSATRRRVQELVKKFGTSSNNIIGGIPFQIISPENLDEIFRKANLDKGDKDDMFIGTVLSFKFLNPKSEICVVSNDLGVQLKCKAHKITCMIPPERYLIQEEDSATKENKKLTAELYRLKNLQPNLNLQFDNNESYKKFDVNEPQKDIEVTREVGGLTLKQTLVTFDHEITIVLNIEITNSGNTPGKDIDIYMHFPDGIDLREEPKHYSMDREFPSPGLSAYCGDIARYFPIEAFPKAPAPNLGRLSINKTKGYDVRDHFESLKHNHTASIKPLCITFDGFYEIQNFEIGYVITAANMVEAVKGTLNVVFQKNQLRN